MESVFIVYYDHEISCESNGVPYVKDDVRMIGIYSSLEKANLAIERACNRPEFSESCNDLTVFECEIGKDHWEEGYFTWTPDAE